MSCAIREPSGIGHNLRSLRILLKIILWDDMWNVRLAQDEAMELAHRFMFFRIAVLDTQTMREIINVRMTGGGTSFADNKSPI